MRLSTAAACAICLLSGWEFAANAQQPTAVNQGAMGAAYMQEGNLQDDFLRQETVMTRTHPETDPLGVHAGSWLILPNVGMEEKYNDNIYATNTAQIRDYVTTVSPSVAVRSNWNNGLVAFSATNADTFYANHTSENTNDYSFNGNGRLDITRQEYISVRGGYSEMHEDRTSPNNNFGLLPTVFSLSDAEFEYFNKLNRVSFTLDGIFNRYDYKNTATTTGFITETDRDRDEMTGSARIGYELKPLFEAYVKGTYSEREYDHKVGADGYQRSSKGYSGTAGIALDLGGVTFGEIGVGYMSRTYDDSRFGTVSGPTANAALTWNVTPITTLRLVGQRTIEETITFATPGFVASVATLTVDHELLRNFILNGALNYSYNDYRENTRRDTILGANFGGTYLLNRYVNLGLKYSYHKQDSTVSTASFAQNLALVSLNLRM